MSLQRGATRFECLALEAGLSCCGSIMDQGVEGCSTPGTVRSSVGSSGAEGALALAQSCICTRSCATVSPSIRPCSERAWKL